MKRLKALCASLLIAVSMTAPAKDSAESEAVREAITKVQEALEGFSLTGIWVGYYEQFDLRWKMTMILVQDSENGIFQGTITDLLEPLPRIGFRYSELVNMEYEGESLTFTKDYQVFHEDQTIRNIRAAQSAAASNVVYDLKLTRPGRLEGSWKIQGTDNAGKAVFRKVTDRYIDGKRKAKIAIPAEKITNEK